MYHSILVPIDTSAMEKAAQMLAAAKVLGGPNSTVTCLNVMPELPVSVAMEIPAEVKPRLMAEAKETIQKAANAADLPVDIEIETGHPAQTILQHAKANGSDLIIVGSHKPGLEDYLLGSTASRVVRHAGCCVLVLR